MMKKLAMLCLLLSCCGLLVPLACGDEKPKEEKVFKATIGDDGVQQVEMVGGTDFYRPNHVIVKVNVPVELKVKKEPGMAPHDIVMKSPEAGMDFKESLDEKKPTAIKFTPTKTGSFPFYCDKRLWPFKSHREKGMEGTLEVVE